MLGSQHEWAVVTSIAKALGCTGQPSH